MPYSELIKNFDNIRDYMREFYVYGFKSREEFDRKSARSYDDSRRRIESWLADNMSFTRTGNGKNLYISVDSRKAGANPLFRAWKSKSFTDGDITLHFILMDILADDCEHALKDIMADLDSYSEGFVSDKTFDISTVRKKLTEYEEEGLVRSRKDGRTVFYSREPLEKLPSADLLRFFSEVMPCGVIGSFIEDKAEPVEPAFGFKHHYITGTIDSGILCDIFDAMQAKRTVKLTGLSKEGEYTDDVIPLRVMVSVQSGRQHLVVFSLNNSLFRTYRTDHIISVEQGPVCDYYDDVRTKLDSFTEYMWGVSVGTRGDLRTSHVEFEVEYHKGEEHIRQRLEREKRCGTVTEIGEGILRFEADVLDENELVPWIRTFIGRLTRVSFENKALEKRFLNDIRIMYEQYGGGSDERVQ